MATCKRCGKKGLLLKVNDVGLCADCEKQVLVDSYETTIHDLADKLSPEQQDIQKLQSEISALHEELSQLQQEKDRLSTDISSLQEEKAEVQKDIIDLRDAVTYQDFGLYEPRFDFCSVEEYKDALDEIRQQEKNLIKENKAVWGATNWTVNNDPKQGKKMVNDTKKLLLRAFNTECDDIIQKVKYNNIEASINRIERSRDAISKLGIIMNIEISYEYYSLKTKEAYIALEYQIKKQEEKERRRELKAQEAEEKRVQKEIEAERKKIEKEKKHYLNALQTVLDQIDRGEGDQEALKEKKAEIQNQLGEIDKSLIDIDYRAANQRAGFVYVISNIGSFGPDVYKIGMTRRLDPTERVDELGDASVPFKFDIHAMIFSDDAPALEAALHRAFDSRKLNLINTRREFFRVTLDEIKEEVRKNYDKTTEWFDEPIAEQYRISEKMRNSL